MYDKTIREQFFRTCSFLTLCSSNGIIFNKEKFQFSQKEVEYLGFEITADSVKPSESIRDFPQPTDITGIRSWFGLVNQVAYAFSMTNTMKPFREMLKPTTEFIWTDELQKSFTESKEAIRACMRRIKIHQRSRKPLRSS